MSDAMKKVQSGQPLVIPAGAYNAFIDTALDFRQRTTHLGQGRQPSFAQASLVLVRNDSGSDLDRFEILGIDAPVIDPVDNEEAFKNRVAVSGVTPVIAPPEEDPPDEDPEDSHEGRFVVLAEPVKSGKIGRAFAAGVCPVKIDVEAQYGPPCFVEIADGISSHLKLNPRGSATILWLEGGGVYPGLQWALVRLGNPPPSRSVIQVTLSQVGGTQGDGENPATWTYDVADALSGEPLESAVSPVAEPHLWQRPSVGAMQPATFGYAHFEDFPDDGEAGEVLVLGWINEVVKPNFLRYDWRSRQLQIKVGNGTWTMIPGGQAVPIPS